MRMTAIEKRFVNSEGHTLQVARRARRLLDRIDINPGRRYLDVGCGVGATAGAIARTYGLDVTGIDIDPRQIETARAREVERRTDRRPVPRRFLVMDATKLEFPDAEFDIVATSMATHHIPGWERAFGEMIRVLRPGGYLIYSDFMFPGWLAAAGRRLIPFVGFPSRNAIEDLASRAGLSKVYQSRAGMQADFIWARATGSNA